MSAVDAAAALIPSSRRLGQDAGHSDGGGDDDDGVGRIEDFGLGPQLGEGNWEEEEEEEEEDHFDRVFYDDSLVGVVINEVVTAKSKHVEQGVGGGFTFAGNDGNDAKEEEYEEEEYEDEDEDEDEGYTSMLGEEDAMRREFYRNTRKARAGDVFELSAEAAAETARKRVMAKRRRVGRRE